MTAAQVHRVVRRIPRRRLGIAAVDISDRLGRADGALNIDRVVGRMRRRRRRIGHRTVDVVQIAGRQRLYGQFIVGRRSSLIRIAAVDISVRRRLAAIYGLGVLVAVVVCRHIRCTANAVCRRTFGAYGIFVVAVGSRTLCILRKFKCVCGIGVQQCEVVFAVDPPDVCLQFIRVQLDIIPFDRHAKAVACRQQRATGDIFIRQIEIVLLKISYAVDTNALRVDVQRIALDEVAVVGHSGGRAVIIVRTVKLRLCKIRRARERAVRRAEIDGIARRGAIRVPRCRSHDGNIARGHRSARHRHGVAGNRSGALFLAVLTADDIAAGERAARHSNAVARHTTIRSVRISAVDIRYSARTVFNHHSVFMRAPADAAVHIAAEHTAHEVDCVAHCRSAGTLAAGDRISIAER